MRGMRSPLASVAVAAVLVPARLASAAPAEDAALPALPAPQIVFPNAQPAPAVDAPPPSPPPTPKLPPEPVQFSVGPSLVAAAMGPMPLLDVVADVPVGRGFALRGWFDVPLASKSLGAEGGTSEVSVWMGGLGFERLFGQREDRVRLRLHTGWGATVLHARAVAADTASGLTLTKKPQDLFTLLGQAGIEGGVRVAGPVRVVAGARVGTLVSRFVVEHGPGREVGTFGPPFAALDLRVEVQP